MSQAQLLAGLPIYDYGQVFMLAAPNYQLNCPETLSLILSSWCHPLCDICTSSLCQKPFFHSKTLDLFHKWLKGSWLYGYPADKTVVIKSHPKIRRSLEKCWFVTIPNCLGNIIEVIVHSTVSGKMCVYAENNFIRKMCAWIYTIKGQKRRVF